MYNKNQFKKVNDKKILHKVKKHWVTISVAMLGLIGGGTAVTSVHANADTNPMPNNQANHTLNNNIHSQNQLVDDQANHSSQFNNNLYSNASDQLKEPATVTPKNIAKRANKLHQNIVENSFNKTTNPINSSVIPSKRQLGNVDNSNDNVSSEADLAVRYWGVQSDNGLAQAKFLATNEENMPGNQISVDTINSWAEHFNTPDYLRKQGISYVFDPNVKGTDHGVLFDQSIRNQLPKTWPAGNHTLDIYGTLANPNAVKSSTIKIEYDNLADHDKALNGVQESDTDSMGAPFSLPVDFKSAMPKGYRFVRFGNQVPKAYPDGNTPYIIHVDVKPVNRVVFATIMYKDKKDGGIVGAKSITGNTGDPISQNVYKDNLNGIQDGQDYQLVGINPDNSKIFSNGETLEAYVARKSNVHPHSASNIPVPSQSVQPSSSAQSAVPSNSASTSASRPNEGHQSDDENVTLTIIYWNVPNNNGITDADPIVSDTKILPIKGANMSKLLPQWEADFNTPESLKDKGTLYHFDSDVKGTNHGLLFDRSVNNAIPSILPAGRHSLDIFGKAISKPHNSYILIEYDDMSKHDMAMSNYQKVTTGLAGTSFFLNSNLQIPTGFRFIKFASPVPKVYPNGNPYVIKVEVTPNKNTVESTINYVDKKTGQSIGTRPIDGEKGQTIPSDIYIDNLAQLPNGNKYQYVGADPSNSKIFINNGYLTAYVNDVDANNAGSSADSQGAKSEAQSKSGGAPNSYDSSVSKSTSTEQSAINSAVNSYKGSMAQSSMASKQANTNNGSVSSASSAASSQSMSGNTSSASSEISVSSSVLSFMISEASVIASYNQITGSNEAATSNDINDINSLNTAYDPLLATKKMSIDDYVQNFYDQNKEDIEINSEAAHDIKVWGEDPIYFTYYHANPNKIENNVRSIYVPKASAEASLTDSLEAQVKGLLANVTASTSSTPTNINEAMADERRAKSNASSVADFETSLINSASAEVSSAKLAASEATSLAISTNDAMTSTSNSVKSAEQSASASVSNEIMSASSALSSADYAKYVSAENNMMALIANETSSVTALIASIVSIPAVDITINVRGNGDKELNLEAFNDNNEKMKSVVASTGSELLSESSYVATPKHKRLLGATLGVASTSLSPKEMINTISSASSNANQCYQTEIQILNKVMGMRVQAVTASERRAVARLKNARSKYQTVRKLALGAIRSVNQKLSKTKATLERFANQSSEVAQSHSNNGNRNSGSVDNFSSNLVNPSTSSANTMISGPQQSINSSVASNSSVNSSTDNYKASKPESKSATVDNNSVSNDSTMPAANHDSSDVNGRDSNFEDPQDDGENSGNTGYNSDDQNDNVKGIGQLGAAARTDSNNSQNLNAKLPQTNEESPNYKKLATMLLTLSALIMGLSSVIDKRKHN